MDHKTLEAKATATDQGEFTAIAAAYTVDRMNERILPGAFKASIDRWQGSGKQIPLHWDHMTEAENIIGTVDPSSMREVKDGLEVKGMLDLEENSTAREAWRLMKKNAVALSFGYLVLSDAKDSDGVRELKDLDLFEITITPAPANPDTRFIDMKSATNDWLQKMIDDPDVMVLSPEAVIEGDELKGVQEGLVKAVWTAAYVNDLPDSSFLYVESGDKDEDGKTTPRSKRHFPYKDANGSVDLPHLRNALARIPQSSLSQDVKDRLTEKAQSILDDAKAIEDRSEEPSEAKLPQDPLTAQHDELVFEMTTRGVDLKQPARVKKVEEEDKPSPPTLDEFQRQLDEIELDIRI